jgi:hypothetical protein
MERGFQFAESQDKAKIDRQNLLMELDIGRIVLKTHIELSKEIPNGFELGQHHIPFDILERQ